MIGTMRMAAGPAVATDASSRLVDVRDLEVSFKLQDKRVGVINGVSFHVDNAETLCLVGESGSGKSVSLRSLIRLLPSHSEIKGSIRVDGRDVRALGKAELRRLRGSVVSMIFQDPSSAFDPTYTVGQQMSEAIRAHEPVSRFEALRRARDLLDLVQVPSADRRLDAYPFELSGGLRQRAMIALALSCRPKLLLADEPTTALDATVQSQILALLRQLQREFGMGIIFVTHDVGVACEIADRVGVMYAGRIVELGSVEQVISSPAHPYTRGLLASAVKPATRGHRLDWIPGTPPDLAALPPGCSFAPRCRHAQAACGERLPQMVALAGGQQARCILADARHAGPQRHQEKEWTSS